jgi:hypothetical protein
MSRFATLKSHKIHVDREAVLSKSVERWIKSRSQLKGRRK